MSKTLKDAKKEKERKTPKGVLPKLTKGGHRNEIREALEEMEE